MSLLGGGVSCCNWTASLHRSSIAGPKWRILGCSLRLNCRLCQQNSELTRVGVRSASLRSRFTTPAPIPPKELPLRLTRILDERPT